MQKRSVQKLRRRRRMRSGYEGAGGSGITFLRTWIPSQRERLCPSVWASVTEHRRLGGLNNRHLFSRSSGSQKSKIKLPSGLISSEIFLPGLQMAAFSPSPYVQQQRKGALVSLPLLMRILALWDTTHMTSFNLNDLLKVPIFIYSYIEGRQGFNMRIGGGGAHIIQSLNSGVICYCET